jgi:hypothetical protein
MLTRQLLQVIHRLRTDEECATALRDTIQDLQSQIASSEYRIKELESELDDRSSLLQSRSVLSSSQGGEIAKLRGQLARTEDALYDAQEDLERQAREHAHAIKQLENQSSVSDQGSLQAAFEEALIRAETEKAKADDLASRLGAFGSEVDRVTLSETRLREEVASLRSRSASDEITRIELEKQVARLEEDAELLNVALESKQTELALATRKTAKIPSTPGTASSRTLYSSTSRPAAAMDITPAPRPLSSAATPRPAKRESMTIAQSPFGRPKANPLGSSNKHNRTPEKQKASLATSKIIISTSTTKPKPRTSVGGQTQPVVSRRSSLPVLRRPASVIVDRSMTADLKEEDEDAFL